MIKMVTESIPKGYKETEIGIIPEDWDVKKVKEFTDATSGGTPSTSIPEYWGGNVRWMSSGELNFKRIFDVKGRITEKGLNNSSARLIPPNCVLIGLAGQGKTRGTVAINYVTLSTNQSIGAIYPNDSFDSEYLYQNLDYRYQELRELSTGAGGRGGLNLTIIRNLLIPLPKSKQEQSAIAQALSETDELIQQLDKLISKNKDIKKGVMQELLTGKKRLPGFSGEWGRSKLIEITSMPVTDGPHLTPKFLKSGVPFLSVNNIVNYKIDWSDLRYVSKEDDIEFSRKCKPKQGDILLGKAATVGTVAVVESDIDFNIWSPLALIRINGKHIARFFYYYFQTPDLTNQIKLFTNSSSQGNIGMRDIEKLEFPVPSKEEQTAIANVLSDMDSEIEELEQKRDKYQMIKEGMMQQLLTGRIRLNYE